MSWTDQNELMRLGKKMLDATGTSTPSENSMISQLASSTGVGYSVARDAYVKSVLDPLLQEKVRKSMTWLINASFIPEFVDDQAANADLDESAEASAFKPDGVEIPKRMFNIDTGNLEYRPSGQYVILSHSWKGQEISYQYISKIKESQKKKEAYEMLQDDTDEEAKQFASFKAKKFDHLEMGKSDIQLLRAQCTKDIEAQIRKINTLLWRTGVKSNIRELLVQLAEFKIATSEERAAQDAFDEKEEELKLREMVEKGSEKEESEVRTDVLENSIGTDAKNSLSGGLTQVEAKLNEAKKRLSRAKEGCTIMDQELSLRSAVEDLILLLETRKSVNKIEGSMREAKRILDLGLFPSQGRKRYLWNDTCCINKGDANELNESLAMMGQWYNNADFCLVHLDTKESTEWVDTWDHLDKAAEEPNFRTFKGVKEPNWATRGWTLQELVLSKMTFYVNNLWKPLTRPEEGLGPYYYHRSYLAHHIPEFDKLDVPAEAKSTVQDLAKLQKLMDTGEKINYTSYEGCSEKWRMLIGILDYLHVHFPGDMDDDNSNAYIRKTLSLAAYEIESRLKERSPAAARLRSLFNDLGFDLSSIKSQATNLIKLLLRVLIDDCKVSIEDDRKRISEFTQVQPDECCRGLSRSRHPAQDIFLLASRRKCTVPVDRVYSLMGVLGVKFPAFHAEGPTKALCRLLDEVLITSNDISIFNWAGKGLGSPIRGRSLYPSNMSAFSPNNTESYLNTRKNDEAAKASREERHILQDTESRLTLLLRGLLDFVKATPHKDLPVDLIRIILGFIKATSLMKLQAQLENLGKLFVYVKDTRRFEEYKPRSRSWADGESAKSVVDEGKSTQIGGNIASRFGVNTPKIPQMPQMPQMPQFSAPKLKVGGFQSFYGKKAASKEPEPAIESSNAVALPQPPVIAVPEPREPETLVGEIKDWISQKISQKQDILNVPEEFKPLFKNLQAPKVSMTRVNRQKSNTKETSYNDSMICPNPITLTTSGIEGIFDIQRVIITMQNAEQLRCQVESSVSENEKISGECAISTGLSTITVNFSCAAGDLRKQLDVCDVVKQALFDAKVEEVAHGSTQTEQALTTGQESTSYYSKITSLSSGLMRQGSQVSGTTENDDKKKTQDEETQTQAFDQREEQRRVVAMLDFVQETDINLIVGEWVLARFTGAEGAKWFLCQLELGSTHNFYGRRIATDEIDFKTVVPEPGLLVAWKSYMQNKKEELCRVVTAFIQGRDARKYADEVAGPEKEKKERAAKIEGGADEDSDSGVSDPKERLMDFIKLGTHIGAGLVQNVTDRWGERLDGMLSDTILQKVPKDLRAAIVNLNENKDLLPAMFLSGVKIHMF